MADLLHIENELKLLVDELIERSRWIEYAPLLTEEAVVFCTPEQALSMELTAGAKKLVRDWSNGQ